MADSDALWGALAAMNAPLMAKVPPNFQAHYNTALSPEDEGQFQGWLAANSKIAGRDLGGDLTDYDLRGQFKGTAGAMIEPGHGTDTYKKPNHPTFSDESIYHDPSAGTTGGSWGDHTFTPGKTNLQMYGKPALKSYFDAVEPDVRLVVPSSRANDLAKLLMTSAPQPPRVR